MSASERSIWQEIKSHDCHMTITWLSHDHIRDGCYLVEDRDDGETCFRCQEEVGHSLSLNTLKIKIKNSMQSCLREVGHAAKVPSPPSGLGIRLDISTCLLCVYQ